MAKESMKAREVKRVKLANRYAHKREEIAAKVKSGEMDHEEAWIALSKLPRNSNPIRQHNRCKITGRPKGYIRLFGISRIQFREIAGNIFGCRESRYPKIRFSAGRRVRGRRNAAGAEGAGAPTCAAAENPGNESGC